MVIRTRDNTPTGWLHRFPVAGFGSEHTRTMHTGQTRRLRDDCHTTDHVNDITTGTRIRLTVIRVIIQRIGVNSVTFQVPLWCYRGPYSITFVSAYAFPSHCAYVVPCRAEKERPVPEHGLISFAGAVTGHELTRPYRPNSWPNALSAAGQSHGWHGRNRGAYRTEASRRKGSASKSSAWVRSLRRLLSRLRGSLRIASLHS